MLDCWFLLSDAVHEATAQTDVLTSDPDYLSIGESIPQDCEGRLIGSVPKYWCNNPTIRDVKIHVRGSNPVSAEPTSRRERDLQDFQGTAFGIGHALKPLSVFLQDRVIWIRWLAGHRRDDRPGVDERCDSINMSVHQRSVQSSAKQKNFANAKE